MPYKTHRTTLSKSLTALTSSTGPFQLPVSRLRLVLNPTIQALRQLLTPPQPLNKGQQLRWGGEGLPPKVF